MVLLKYVCVYIFSKKHKKILRKQGGLTAAGRAGLKYKVFLRKKNLLSQMDVKNCTICL